MIRRHLAVWATHPTALAIGGAITGTTVGLWLLLVAGPIPLLGAGFIVTQLLIRPHPAHVRRVAPQAPASGYAVAAGVAAPAPGWGAGAGAAHTPTRILAGWAGRPVVGSPFPRTPAAGRHRSGGTQLPARRGCVVYTPGRAAVVDVRARRRKGAV
jgi:hypothetical protein